MNDAAHVVSVASRLTPKAAVLLKKHAKARACTRSQLIAAVVESWLERAETQGRLQRTVGT
jgi:hypothetical protein